LNEYEDQIQRLLNRHKKIHQKIRLLELGSRSFLLRKEIKANEKILKKINRIVIAQNKTQKYLQGRLYEICNNVIQLQSLERRVMPELFDYNTVAVQPMSKHIGVSYALRYLYEGGQK
jgi:hypothetical protein